MEDLIQDIFIPKKPRQEAGMGENLDWIFLGHQLRGKPSPNFSQNPNQEKIWTRFCRDTGLGENPNPDSLEIPIRGKPGPDHSQNTN